MLKFVNFETICASITLPPTTKIYEDPPPPPKAAGGLKATSHLHLVQKLIIREVYLHFSYVFKQKLKFTL